MFCFKIPKLPKCFCFSIHAYTHTQNTSNKTDTWKVAPIYIQSQPYIHIVLSMIYTSPCAYLDIYIHYK